jgi:hypothetical protein
MVQYIVTKGLLMQRTIIAVVSVLFFSNFGCKEEVIPPIRIENTRWNIVSQLASLDVRYMIQHYNILYLAAVDPSARLICDSGICNYVDDRGLVYKTTDAVTWTKIKGFKRDIGPMTYHDDTLYCLTSDSIYRLLPNDVWQTAFATPPRLGDASTDGDMVFIRDTLYAMQTVFGNAKETYRIHPDGSYEEVAGPDGLYHYAGSKYIKPEGKEFVYLRPQWGENIFLQFDGYTYTHIENGLTQDELLFSSSNAMVIRGDTLYAGFGGITSAGVIKMLINGQWQQVYDTLPYWRFADSVTPILRAQPTAIAFAGERMYVASNSTGVAEWRTDSGWVQISEGLIHGVIPNFDNKDLYRPVPFLEYFQNKLIVAYGKPGYGPWGGTGVYTYELK